MGAMAVTSARHRRRVQDLERRMTLFRERLRHLKINAAPSNKDSGEVDDEILVMFSPGSYESALRGMDQDLAKIREMTATSNATRYAANAAVQKSLVSDAQLDDGQAIPSDAWLDSASMGLGVGKALVATNQQRNVPMLLGEKKGEMSYQEILDVLVQNGNANNQESVDRLENLEESARGDYRGEEESVYSVMSEMSNMSVASSRMTAGQRRRWHKQQGIKDRTKSNPTKTHLPTHIESSSQMSTVAGRQQSLMGSHPYNCDVFHDLCGGVGPEPPKGLVECSGFSARNTRDGGTEFYPPSSHVMDLFVFNTTKSSYGTMKPTK